MDDKLIISVLNGKKFSFEEKKTFFVGVVTQMLFDTVKFKRNADLSEYLKPYEKELNKGKPFKDYLYKSRTLLAARVARLIIDNTDRNITNLLINSHINYLNRNIILDNTSSKSNNNNNSSLLEDILKERKVK
ncbi:hypothetical protein ABNX05_24350 [Lysinibacillus sp. M3]|uniref:Uncharacterized protein n=1 Tax=Lysinibacillus zambalensis TaxID=3160866 RepID=A0ABV1MYZ5_9BACI